jgi:1-acyl-sn-glycerol-3-phosphate acyltransferase
MVGEPYRAGPVLYVSNHVSYLDIPVLAPFLNAVFVAKSDVSGWPVFGFLSKWDGTVFIHRVSSRSRDQSLHLQDLFKRGRNLILFPEGTSTDGEGVAPFKTSLFSIVTQPTEDNSGVVQPISICYARYADGTPLVGPLTELYGWYGDADLAPHLKRALGLKGAEVEVRFHQPIPVREISNRKELGRIAHTAVVEGVAASRAGGGAIEREKAAEYGRLCPNAALL